MLRHFSADSVQMLIRSGDEMAYFELPNEDYQRLGRLTLSVSRLEALLGHCLKHTLRQTDEEAKLIVLPLSLTVRMDWLRKLTPPSELGKDLVLELDTLLRPIVEMRNSVIHGLVAFVTATGDFHFMNPKNRKTVPVRDMAMLQELVDYAYSVALNLRDETCPSIAPPEIGDRPSLPAGYRYPDKRRNISEPLPVTKA